MIKLIRLTGDSPAWLLDNIHLLRFKSGNRPVDENKVEKYKKLLKKGTTMGIVTVNRNGYIIDGQHRVTATKELLAEGFPIRKDCIEVCLVYSVDDDKVAEEARNSNKNTDWKIKDLVASIANNDEDCANKNCKRVLDFMDHIKSGGITGCGVALCLVVGTYDKRTQAINQNIARLGDEDFNYAYKAYDLMMAIEAQIKSSFKNEVKINDGRSGLAIACYQLVRDNTNTITADNVKVDRKACKHFLQKLSKSGTVWRTQIKSWQ